MILNVTKEQLDTMSSSTHVLNNIQYTGDLGTRPIGTITADNVYKGFANIGMDILKLVANDTKFYNYTTYETGGAVFHCITIQNTTKSAFIFEKFKKLHISMTELMFAFSDRGTGNINTLVVHDKVLKDITTLNVDYQQQLAMYLISLGLFFNKLTTNFMTYREALSFSSLSNTLSISDKATIRVEDLFSPLPTEAFALALEPLPSVNLECIQFYVTSCNIVSNIFITSLNALYTLRNEDTKELSIGLFRDFEASGFEQYYIWDPQYNHIRTNADMNYIYLTPSSILANLAATCKVGNIMTIRTAEAGLGSNCTVFEEYADVPEIAEHPGAGGLYSQVYNKLNSRFTELHIVTKLKSLSTLLSGTTFKTGGFTADPDGIKSMYDADEYAQELYKQIQPYFESFDLKDLNSTIPGFINGTISSMVYTGESGTGKSTAAKVLPTRCGFPFVNINFSVNIEESDLFGSMIPNPTKASADDAEFIWVDGIITRAVREGYVVILEEINFARPGVLGKLNTLLDESRQVELSTGEVVKAHKHFRMIATCNIAYEGTQRFNKALINRFDVVKEFTELERPEVIKIIKERTGYLNDTNINTVLDIYAQIKKFSDEQNLNIVVSLRQLLNIFKQSKYYKTAYDAVLNVIINGAFIEEPDYKKEFVNGVLSAYSLTMKL